MELNKYKLELYQIVDQESFETVWNELEPFLEDCQLHWDTLYTMDWFESQIADRRVQVWALKEKETGKPEFFVLSQIVQYPKQPVLEILLSTGSGLLEYTKQEIEVNGVIEQFAALHGVEVCMIRGRLGLRKMLEGMGYDLYHATYIREFRPMAIN